MGEISDMMLEGVLCASCGVALEQEVIELDVGIPVYCDSCWDDLKDKNKHLLTKESDLIN